MGKSQELMQIEGGNHISDVMDLLGVVTDIQPLLQDKGLGVKHGILLFAEDQRISDYLMDILQKSGAVKVRLKDKNITRLPNNAFVFHMYSAHDKAEDILDFLERDDFLPAVMVFGVVPDYLQDGRNLIPFKWRDIETMQRVDLPLRWEKIADYMHHHPSLILREIGLFKTTGVYQRNKESSSLIIALEVAVRIFGLYFRELNCEEDTEYKMSCLREQIKDFARDSDAYADDCDVLGSVRKAFAQYLDEHTEILLGRIDALEGDFSNAVECDMAVLYDEDWYYVPEMVLRTACEPMFSIVSYPTIKRGLQESGALCCNSTDVTNFTCKKLLTNAFGRSFRKRFLKIKKSQFVANDQFLFEERSRSDVSREI